MSINDVQLSVHVCMHMCVTGTCLITFKYKMFVAMCCGLLSLEKREWKDILPNTQYFAYLIPHWSSQHPHLLQIQIYC
jgi:hypothetical protein